MAGTRTDFTFDREAIRGRLLPVDSQLRSVLSYPGFDSAAILFLLMAHHPPRCYDLVLFRRTKNPRDRHSGEISFPGGRRDAGDATLVDTAARECEEELGIPRRQLTVLGSFDDYSSPKQYIITPVVGFVTAPQSMTKNDDEVDEIIQIPVEFFSKKETYSDTIYELDGERIAVARYEHIRPSGKKDVIWGATGHLISKYMELVHGIRLMAPGTRRAAPRDFVRLFRSRARPTD
ncbi:MAG: CoA pyrophosphatase [Candidatus Lokiarchaeota archaeon]|nr:CoA pyrophosphatase [Candidatus Lokiarchaeota archaeon]